MRADREMLACPAQSAVRHHTHKLLLYLTSAYDGARRSHPCGTAEPLQIKQREFDEATYVESFLVLNVVGADCLEGFDRPDGGPA